MPRDENGVFTPLRDWEADAAAGTPFSPDRWNAQDADFASALNDLPLANTVPTWVAPGTAASDVRPGSMMSQGGIVYVRIDEPVWLDVSSVGLTDAGPIVAEALSQLPVYTEGDTPPASPSVRDEWRDTVSGALYRRVSNSGSPIWQQIG